MRKTTSKNISPPKRRVKIGLKDIAQELDRMAPKEDGSRHNPDWIGRVRRGDGVSHDLEPKIEKAVRNLQSKAA